MDGTHEAGTRLAGDIVIGFMEREDLLDHPESFRIPYGVARDIVQSFKDETAPPSPCRCSAKCDSVCKGQCGCKRCHDDYMDFLSCDID